MSDSTPTCGHCGETTYIRISWEEIPEKHTYYARFYEHLYICIKCGNRWPFKKDKDNQDKVG